MLALGQCFLLLGLRLNCSLSFIGLPSASSASGLTGSTWQLWQSRRCSIALRAEEFSSLKVAELKERLKTLGLPTTGKKDDLIGRLLSASAEDDKQEKEGDGDAEDDGEEEATPEPVEDEGKEDNEGNGEDLEAMRALDLKAMLKDMGLSATGAKGVLISRLKEARKVHMEKDKTADKAPKKISDGGPKQTSASLKAGKAKSGSMFAVGERVEAFFDDEQSWYPAKVIKDNGEGRFTVAWEEDDAECRVEPGYIRKRISDVDRDGPFVVGEAVKALCEDDESWYLGILQKENGDGTFTVLWDEDGQEAIVKVENMMKVMPLLEISALSFGMKLRGTVGNIRDFGAFVDVGATREGLLHNSNMKKKETPAKFEKDGRCMAYFAEDDEWYGAEIVEVNDDGTYMLRWDNDDGPLYKCKDKDMKPEEGSPVSEGEVIDVWVSKVDGDKFGLSMYEGGAARLRSHEYSAFQNIDPDTWLEGKVVSIRHFGVFVELTAPSGSKAQGLVHVSKLREGFVEDCSAEVEVDDEVKVRVVNVDTVIGRMSLSMV